MSSYELQAHRGVSTDYPENTMSAFMGGVYQGYRIIELDPAVTSDDVIVVLHDATINRTGRHKNGEMIEETIRISDITYEEALMYDFGSWYSNKFRGEKIPLLSQVLDMAAKNDILIKIDSKFGKFAEPQIAKLFQVVKNSMAKVAFTCNSIDLIRKVKTYSEDAEIHYDGLVTEDILKEITNIVEKEKLVVWLPYKSELTWWVKIPFADKELCNLVKQYAKLGIWILSEYEQRDDAVDNLGADIIETTGKIKPVMRKGIRTDIHMHSEHSHDCVQPVSVMCKAAMEKEVDVICITDHFDTVGDAAGAGKTEHIAASVRDTKLANEQYGKKIEVLTGVEIGEGFWNVPLFEKVLSLTDYDEIIGSVHFVKDDKAIDAFSRIDFSGYTDAQIEDFMNLYFDDVLQMLREIQCDIVAHLTGPMKYLVGKYGKIVDLKPYYGKIRDILDFIIKHGIALEINTASKQSGYDEFMPEEEIVKLYSEMGGYLITLGADAHSPNRVYHNIDKAVEMLKRNGFKNIFYFKKRYLCQCTI